MNKIIGLFAVFGGMFIGCSQNEVQEQSFPAEKEVLAVTMREGLELDHSLVLFFKQMPGNDSLVYQTEIDGPKTNSTAFTFSLPAGSYQMVIVGNGEADHIKAEGGMAFANMSIRYQGGVSPPDLYYGRVSVEVGEQTQSYAGLLHLTSRVILTVRNIPQGVERVVARIVNTSVGVSFDLVVLKEIANPPVADTLKEVVPGSSPVITFSCFPTVEGTPGTWVEVDCYNMVGKLIFSGRSETVVLAGNESLSVACGFEGTTKMLKSNGMGESERLFILKNME